MEPCSLWDRDPDLLISLEYYIVNSGPCKIPIQKHSGFQSPETKQYDPIEMGYEPWQFLNLMKSDETFVAVKRILLVHLFKNLLDVGSKRRQPLCNQCPPNSKWSVA